MPYYHVAITKKTGRSHWAFAFDLSPERINEEIVKPVTQQMAFMVGKSMIAPSDVEAIIISETEEPASKVLAKTRVKRVLKKFASTSEEEQCIDEWTIVNSGKDVTRKLIKGLDIHKKQPLADETERRLQRPEVSKEELKDYLEKFLELYRSEIKKRYPAYFNEFPFYSALKVIGVISPHFVYIIFTKDDDPTTTTIKVLDENDIPELLRIKDAINMKSEEIYRLMEVKTYIPDLVHSQWSGRISGERLCFAEPNISLAVEESIKGHHTASVETGKGITYVVSGAHIQSVIPKYSFVRNTMDEMALSEKIKGIIDNTEDGEVLVAGWVDSVGMRLLNSLMKRGIKFRIVTHRPSSSESGKAPSDAYEVFSKIAEEHTQNVRILTKLHARLLITDKEALVSTADLTKDSLEAKYEAGISTTDGFAIMKTKEFFEKLWVEGTKLKPTKIDKNKT